MTGWAAARPGGVSGSDARVRLLPAGSAAVLVESTDARRVVDLYLRLRASQPAGVTDLVPAATTVLVAFDDRMLSRPTVVAWVDRVASTWGGPLGEREQRGVGVPGELGAVPDSGGDGGQGAGADCGDRMRGVGVAPLRSEVVELRVRYDGPDLPIVAELMGASVDEVIAAHRDQLWTAAFIGFAPGFAYLSGEDDRLMVPRRETPRPIVPAGSVALAAGYCGVYPRESPGGWHLIGSTDAVLWDAHRAEPALLAPGTRVRFVRER